MNSKLCVKNKQHGSYTYKRDLPFYVMCITSYLSATKNENIFQLKAHMKTERQLEAQINLWRLRDK